MLTLLHTAQTSGGDGGVSSGTVTFYYILGIIVTIGGILVGGYRWYQKQKSKLLEEGMARAKQAQATEENSQQLKKNTEAIDKLSGKFGELSLKFAEFASNVRSEMNGMSNRISRLERFHAGDGKHDTGA